MLKKRIIPCLDVKDGRVVKGVNFVNLTDVGDPVDSARAYYEAGCDELVFWTSRRLQIIVKQRLTWCDALPIRSLSLSQLVVVSVRLKT